MTKNLHQRTLTFEHNLKHIKNFDFGHFQTLRLVVVIIYIKNYKFEGLAILAYIYFGHIHHVNVHR